MVPSAFKGDDWLGANLDDEDFKKNRRDVVSRCIESRHQLHRRLH